jgi:hypothetical protein
MKKLTRSLPNLDALTPQGLRSLKCAGFSDSQVARYVHTTEPQVRHRGSTLLTYTHAFNILHSILDTTEECRL